MITTITWIHKAR